MSARERGGHACAQPICPSLEGRCSDQFGGSVLSRACGAAITAMFGASLLLLTSSCTQTGLIGARPADLAEGHHKAVRGHHIAQVLVDGRAVYVICAEPACPVVTRKTLALGGHEAGDTTWAASAADKGVVNASHGSEPFSVSEAPKQASHLASSFGPVTHAAQVNSEGATSADRDAWAPLPPGTTPRVEPRAVVGFGLNSAVLTQQARRELDRVMPLARRAGRIVISGRTDSLGEPQNNQRLALARAEAVREYMRDRIPHLDKHIAIDAQGACCFIAPNSTAQGRSRNRRVEVVFRPQDGSGEG